MKDIFGKIGLFTRNHFVLVIVLAFVLLVLSMAGASQMEMETGIETFISSDDATYQDFDRLNQDFGSDVIIVMIEGDLNDILSPSNVKAMELIEDQLNGNEKILSASSPAMSPDRCEPNTAGISSNRTNAAVTASTSARCCSRPRPRRPTPPGCAPSPTPCTPNW